MAASRLAAERRFAIEAVVSAAHLTKAVRDDFDPDSPDYTALRESRERAEKALADAEAWARAASLADRAPGFLPWAWGVNGFASVISAALATLLAIEFGFTAVVLLALVLYALAAWLAPDAG